MIERYAREEMKKLWDMNAKYSAWLEVEKALVRGWNKLGLIPDSDCEKICKNVRCEHSGFSICIIPCQNKTA